MDSDSGSNLHSNSIIQTPCREGSEVNSNSLVLLLYVFIYDCVCVCLPVYAPVYACVHGGQKGVSDSLEQMVQAAVSHPR